MLFSDRGLLRWSCLTTWRANVMVALLFSFEKIIIINNLHKYECRMISVVVKKKQQKTERDQVEESERKKNPLIHSPSVVLWAVHLNWCQNERIFVVFFHSVFVCVWVHALFPISYNAIWNVSLLHCIVVRSVMREDHRVIEIHGRKKEKYLETSFWLLPVHCFFARALVCVHFISYRIVHL